MICLELTGVFVGQLSSAEIDACFISLLEESNIEFLYNHMSFDQITCVEMNVCEPHTEWCVPTLIPENQSMAMLP